MGIFSEPSLNSQLHLTLVVCNEINYRTLTPQILILIEVSIARLFVRLFAIFCSNSLLSISEYPPFGCFQPSNKATTKPQKMASWPDHSQFLPVIRSGHVRTYVHTNVVWAHNIFSLELDSQSSTVSFSSMNACLS